MIFRTRPGGANEFSEATENRTPNAVKVEPVENDTKELNDKQSKKRHKSALKDVSLAEAVKHGNFSDFSFFEKVRKALKTQEVWNYISTHTLPIRY